jgi:hypothetical protein
MKPALEPKQTGHDTVQKLRPLSRQFNLPAASLNRDYPSQDLLRFDGLIEGPGCIATHGKDGAAVRRLRHPHNAMGNHASGKTIEDDVSTAHLMGRHRHHGHHFSFLDGRQHAASFGPEANAIARRQKARTQINERFVFRHHFDFGFSILDFGKP